ncbi:MAG TPA: hypothetical protein PK228_16675 [Saprospiraceae bacterium]|nr:hypothetical protein [Saprospiraceae bacterium]
MKKKKNLPPQYPEDDQDVAMLEEKVDESKSSLRPIDANKSPEEWRKLPKNHPLKVKDKKD